MDNGLDTLALYKRNKVLRKKIGISARQIAACKSALCLRLMSAPTEDISKYLKFPDFYCGHFKFEFISKAGLKTGVILKVHRFE